MDTFLGLDFGGTKLLIGEVDEKGTVLNCKRYRTGADNQKNAVEIIFTSLADYMQTFGFQGNLRAAGLGIIGTVNNREGKWIAMGQEENVASVPLAQMLQRQLQVPCAVDNDVKAATTAELLLGQGRFSKNFIYLNVGTGLAAGIVSEGHIVRGANNNAGEIGHMVTDFGDQRRCMCGRLGCAENSVSGAGFTRRIKEYRREDLLDSYGKADVKALLQKADQGDAICVEIIDYGAKTLTNVIMNLVRATDPDMIILGGRYRIQPGVS